MSINRCDYNRSYFGPILILYYKNKKSAMITRVLKEMMKTVNKEILKEAANKLMFDMEDSQYQTLLDEFDVILERMELISEIPGIDDALPMTFPFDVTVAYMREDVVTKPLSQEEALKNAGDVVEGQIRLPKVVG